MDKKSSVSDVTRGSSVTTYIPEERAQPDPKHCAPPTNSWCVTPDARREEKERRI